ncbi:MAG: MBL fold metallo-hydrolase [Acidimicrobiales bacterium]|nr:MBL fold metallo-hydrolase [Acidimicrobiales bacterium]
MSDDTTMARKDATDVTAAANRVAAGRLPSDTSDVDLVRRGLIAPLAGPVLHPTLGFPMWDQGAFAFLEGEPTPTVHPSLWRQAQLNTVAGLFEVVEGIYQVRGIDISNVTFVAGETGWIVIDPLSSAETARAALDLVHAHLPERPVVAVIYTHSHVDHFGGVRGIIDEADVVAGKVRVLAPTGFLRAAISENVNAGMVMNRRATYMYGPLLPRDPQGHVDCGLGKAIPLLGTVGLIAPTEEIATTGTELVVDGVRIVFQYTPDTEAPAEMNFFFPDQRALCMAENCSAVLHNVYTLRGAQIRDALGWSKYIDEAIERFGADTDVVFTSHHWPRWGRDEATAYLAAQRDAYRFVHDQTLRLANHGLTAVEIAEELRFPPELEQCWFVHDYYGTLNHNVKAVYQRYLGWFDANPAHLHPLTPVEAAVRYVEFMGGADEVLRRARASFEAGDYRWVAEVVNHVVFADPTNAEARALQADTLEQLGYQAESGPWRDFYLTGAQELRTGVPPLGSGMSTTVDVMRAMTTEMLLDLLGVRLDGPSAAGRLLGVNLVVTDRDERWFVAVERGALRAAPGRHDAAATVTVSLAHLDLARLASGHVTLDQLEAEGGSRIDGRRETLVELLDLLDQFSMGFAIVEP